MAPGPASSGALAENPKLTSPWKEGTRGAPVLPRRRHRGPSWRGSWLPREVARDRGGSDVCGGSSFSEKEKAPDGVGVGAGAVLASEGEPWPLKSRLLLLQAKGSRHGHRGNGVPQTPH